MDGAVNVDDAALGVVLRGLGGLLEGAYALYDDRLLFGIYRHNDTTLALVLAGDNEDVVAFLHVGLHRVCVWFVLRYTYTSPEYAGVADSTRLLPIRQA